MIWWKEYLDGTVFWKKKWIFVGKKNGIFVGKKKGFLVGKPMVFLYAGMNIYAKQKEKMNKYPKQWL